MDKDAVTQTPCQYKYFFSGEKECHHPPLTGGKFCLFHSQNDTKDKNAFWDGIQKKLQDKDFDFEGYYFPLGLKADFYGIKFTDANFRLTIFKDRVSFFDAKFSGEGTTDFSDTIFSNGANFRGATFSGDGSAVFFRATFSGEGGADFFGARFSGKGGADFRGAEFSGEGGANFRLAIFFGDGATDFSEARFSSKGGVDFCGARFPNKGGTYFYNARFSGEGTTDFRRTEFSGAGGANFRLAIFSGEGGAHFGGATFLGGGSTNFSLTTFSGKSSTQFIEAKFSKEGGTDFSSAEFLGEDGICWQRAEFSGKGGTDFRWVKFSGCDTTLFVSTEFNVACKFLEARFPWRSHQFVLFHGETRNPIDLSKCSFLYSNPDRLIFRNFKFIENEPEKFLGLSIWRRNFVLVDEKTVDRGETVTTTREEAKAGKETQTKQQEEIKVDYSHVESLYRQFKKNLEEERNWEDAGEFHYGEMECKRKGLTWFWRNFGLIAWYRYLSGYGERPLRALCGLVFFIFLFAVFYCWLDAPPRQDFWDYYLWNLSIKAAFLQRIGETGNEPVGFFDKLIYLLESVLCPTLIALFILALRRRVKR